MKMRILRIPLIESNNMSLTLSYEAQRDLLTGMVYKRSNTTVATRSYEYDTPGRPSTRSTAKDGITHNDVFHYTKRSERQEIIRTESLKSLFLFYYDKLKTLGNFYYVMMSDCCATILKSLKETA